MIPSCRYPGPRLRCAGRVWGNGGRQNIRERTRHHSWYGQGCRCSLQQGQKTVLGCARLAVGLHLRLNKKYHIAFLFTNPIRKLTLNLKVLQQLGKSNQLLGQWFCLKAKWILNNKIILLFPSLKHKVIKRKQLFSFWPYSHYNLNVSFIM